MDSLDTVLSSYRRSEAVISARLHGCIIAAAMGRKIVAVAQDHKVDGFMSSIGLSQWVCDPGNLERLPMLLDQLSAQPSPARHIANAIKSNQAIARRIRSLYHTLQ